MPYIGKSPVGGGFHKLDNLTASATATYALTLNGAAYFPETANQLLVSLNGVIQAPQDSFTVSGSNLIFDSALTSSDSIDFVVALGDVLGVGSVTDGAITTAKIGNSAVTKAKIGTTELDLATIKDSTGTTTAMTIDSTGRVLQPAKPFFHVTEANNTGGVGITGQLAFDTVVTNIGSHYDTAGFFKAPVAGVYQFNFSGFGSGNTIGGAVGAGSNCNVILQKATDDAFTTGLVSFASAFSQVVSSTSFPNISVSGSVYLAANDRVRAVMGSNYVFADATTIYDPHFSGYLIG